MEKTSGFLSFFRTDDEFDRLLLDMKPGQKVASPLIYTNGTDLYNSTAHLYSDFYGGNYEKHVSTGLYLIYNKIFFVWHDKIDANLLDSIILDKEVELVGSSILRKTPTVKVKKQFIDSISDFDKIDICQDILSSNFPNEKFRIIPSESFESLIDF